MNDLKIEHVYDFYYLEAMRAGMMMAKSANPELEFKHSFERLDIDVQNTFDKLSKVMAERLRFYLWQASLGEARHASGRVTRRVREIDGHNRSYVYAQAHKYPMTDENIETIVDLFENEEWGSAYGGSKWAEIARAVKLYEQLTPAAFVDYVVDLEHNGGCALNKNAPYFDNENLWMVKQFLDTKFSKDILNQRPNAHDPAELTLKVHTLLQRYNNVVAKIKVIKYGYVTATNDMPTEFDIVFGNETLELDDCEAYRCASCGDCIDPDDACTDEDGYTYCSSCFDDKFVCCEKCNETIARDDAIEVDGWLVCEHCAENKLGAVKCDDCGDWTTDYSVTDNGNAYCENCIENNAQYCELCNEWQEDIDYHNEHDHEGELVKCPHCEQWVEELDEHALDEHYEPTELWEGEGLTNEFHPIEPDFRTIKTYTICSWQGDKTITGEVWYDNGENFIRQDNGLYVLSFNSGAFLGSSKDMAKLHGFQLAITPLMPKGVNKEKWDKLSQSTKDKILAIKKEWSV